MVTSEFIKKATPQFKVYLVTAFNKFFESKTAKKTFQTI